MDRTRWIVYGCLVVAILFVLYLAWPPPRTGLEPFPLIPDRSGQSEFERGAGSMRDTKAVHDWMKKNIGDD